MLAGALLLASLGQSIWSGADVPVFEASRKIRPELDAAVLVATFEFRDGRLERRAGNEPSAAGTDRPVAIVVRLDPTMDGAWSREEVVGDLDTGLRGVLAAAEERKVRISEVQLDYDCPVSRLVQWSDALRRLRKGSLAGHPVWITALPAQLSEPRYSGLFRKLADGHVVQLSGEPTEVEARHLIERLRSQRIRFRLGITPLEGGRKNRSGWLALLPRFAAEPGFDGVIVFPAGQDWTSLLPADFR